MIDREAIKMAIIITALFCVCTAGVVMTIIGLEWVAQQTLSRPCDGERDE